MRENTPITSEYRMKVVSFILDDLAYHTSFSNRDPTKPMITLETDLDSS
jgi:hypothetical protein